jgi:hypothetical protein
VCELKGGGSCEGTCHGECTFEATAEAECSGTCEGSCSGECTGGCEGEFEPPTCDAEASASCEASADCKAQASAQASANLSCTPPSIALDYGFDADADAATQAAVSAKLAQFKTEMIAIVQGTAELRALVDADYADELGITSPVIQIAASIDTFAEKVAKGEFKITAVGLLPCAAPAFADAAVVLTTLPVEMAATVQVQLSLAALINI